MHSSTLMVSTLEFIKQYKEQKMKNFIVAIICALLVVGLGVSIYFNFDAIKAQATLLYTKEQMEYLLETLYHNT